MLISHTNRNLVESSLEELLLKGYLVDDLLPIYNGALLASRGEEPPTKRTKKVKIVEDILALSKGTKAKVKFLEHLPDLLRRAMSILIWEDRIRLDKLEKKLGQPIAITKKGKYGHWEIQLLEGLELIAVEVFTSYGYSARESEIWVFLPRALSGFLKPAFPKPEGYHYTPLETNALSGTKKNPLQFYDCSKDALHDQTQVADYLSRGSLKMTKSGKLTKAAFRAAMKLTRSGEFFTEEKGASKFADLRHEFLVEVMMEETSGYANKIADGKVSPGNILENFIGGIQSKPDLLYELLLPHIKKSYAHENVNSRRDNSKNLVSLFAQLPEHGWVTRENIYQYQFYRNIDCCLINRYECRYKAESCGTGHYEYRYNYDRNLDSSNINELIEKPLINGLAFILAAFGLVEIAYTYPTAHEFWRFGNKDYLTRFDGLCAVRLTDLGRYAFGYSKTLDVELETPQRCEITFHSERLRLSCKNLDPVTEAVLKEYMEPITPRVYRMTRASFLKKCTTMKDIKNRVIDFRKRLPGNLPENWVSFLKELENEMPALKSKSALRVFELADNPDLRELFSKDLILRKNSIRAEGWRVLIHNGKLSVVKDRLRKLGFVPDA